MNNRFDLYKQKDAFIQVLSIFLKKGQLTLILGAGVSIDIGLPDWSSLVKYCVEEIKDLTNDVDFSGKRSPQELSEIMSRVKAKCNTQEDYIKLVQKSLYKNNPNLDFYQIEKNLLIAIGSLIVGNTRGSVKNIMNLNFDSFLEWFLLIYGLKVSIIDKVGKIKENSDVDILHPHGFLPHPKLTTLAFSDEILFTWEEQKIREISNSLWKSKYQDFFRESIFFTIGVHPNSVSEYIIPYLLEIKTNIDRKGYPFGFVLCPEGEMTESNVRKFDSCDVVYLECKKEEIPEIIFDISQQSIGLNIPRNI
jgi:hypothetical protein